MFGPSVKQGFRVPPKTTLAIRAHALRVRKLLGVDKPFFKMGLFMEGLSDSGIVIDVVEGGALPTGVEACCVPELRMIMLSEETYHFACQDDGRARFTVIHELGHLVLAHARTFHRDTGRRIEAYEDSEWQANTFAAEFLMPVNDIQERGLRTPQQLMLEYQVSAMAAEVRVRKLKDQKLL